MVFLPLLPNWRTPVQMVYQFKTEIIVSRSGVEQRRALRSTPRRQVEFDVLLDNDGGRENLRLFRDNQHLQVEVAEVARGVPLRSALASTSRTINLDRLPSWIVPGATVALYDARRVARAVVQAAAGGVVTLAAVTGQSWLAGCSLVPVSVGRVYEDATIGMSSAGVGTMRARYRAEPGVETPDRGAPGTMFEGLEVLGLRPNWSATPSVVLARPVERVDYDRGRVNYRTPIDFGSRNLQTTHTTRSALETEKVVQFFARQRGRRGAFYSPSWTADMRPLAGLAPGSSAITVEGGGLAESWPQEKVNRVLSVINPDGRIAVSRVQSVTRSGLSSVVSLATPIPADFDTSGGAMLSWCPKTRFSSDDLTIEHLAQTTTRFILNRITLPDTQDHA